MKKQAKRAHFITVFLAALGPACSPAPNIVPSTGLNRPTDIAFMCLGAFEVVPGAPLEVSGRPMYACHPTGRNTPDPVASPTSRTFGFMPNSASGDLSVIDANSWRPLDLDPGNAGYARLSVGDLPEQVSASTDGCRLVTTNRGSCDLSLVDPAVLLAPVMAQTTDRDVALPPRPPVAQVKFVKADGTTLRAAPYETVFLPQNTESLLASQVLCSPGGTGTPSWQALVTFPSCNLVALVDLPTGRIVDSAKVNPDGTLDPTEGGSSPTCPAECPDALAGLPIEPRAATSQRPTSIAIVPNGSRAYVGLASSPFILSIALSTTGLDLTAGNTRAIELTGTSGTNRVRLGVEPYVYKTTMHDFPGRFVGDTHKNSNGDVAPREYLYAIARDATVRVVDVSNRDSAPQPDRPSEMECETNADPLAVAEDLRQQLRDSKCLPVGTARRPFASGPGITSPQGIPIDITAAEIVTGDGDTRPSTVNGGYAWVLTSSGAVFLVNIDPVRRDIEQVVAITDPVTGRVAGYEQATLQEVEPFANSIRDRNQISYATGIDPATGPPRVEVSPLVPPLGPFIERFWAKGTENNATALDADFLATSVYFPERYAATPQTWNVTWEGPLLASISGQVFEPLTAETPLDQGGFGVALQKDSQDRFVETLFGTSVDICGGGALAGDILTLPGCTIDRECGPGKVCHRDPTVDQVPGGLEVTGLCVDPLDEEAFAAACETDLRTLRRYELVRFPRPPNSRTDLIVMRPRRDELVLSELKHPQGCLPSMCRDPMDQDPDTCCTGSGDNPRCLQEDTCHDPKDPNTLGFSCVADRAALDVADPVLGPFPNRCLMPCDPDTKCRNGRTCVEFDAFGSNFCADARPLDWARCFPESTTYELNVGRGFLVTGSSTGNLEAGRGGYDQASSQCIPTGGDPRLVARIPLNPPLGALSTCSTFPANLTPAMFTNGQAPPAAAMAEDLFAVLKTPPAPTSPCYFIGGPNGITTDAEEENVRAVFRNTQVAFVLGNLDRSPTTSLNLQFEVRGGFLPQIVRQVSSVEVSMPARIVVGPIDSRVQGEPPGTEAPYVFVVDQRRLGRGQAGGPVRGQLLRINPLVGVTNGGDQPIYEDFQRSGGLFPIQ